MSAEDDSAARILAQQSGLVSGDTVDVVAREETFDPFEVGQSLGRYVILHRAGAGGMAVVYAAYDPELDRKVAIKVLRANDGAVKPEDWQKTLDHERTRALREAQALAKLSHPNVLPVFDVGAYEGRVFFATEFVEGWTLKEWLEAEKRSVREIVQVMKAAGRGLAAAHAQGFVHRDFKPQNVMIGRDGQVRVMDFGLVRQGEGESDIVQSGSEEESVRSSRSREIQEGLTASNMILGTPHYMAPEQHMGMVVDARADQYAYCVSFYEALWGVQPFSGLSRKNLLRAKQKMKFASGATGREVPRWLSKVILRGLQAKPAERWASMEAVLEALKRDPAQRRKQGIAAVATLAFLGGGTLGYGEYREAQAAVCSGGPARLSGVWDEARKKTLERAFLATEVSYATETWMRVREHLDAYSKAWTGMHRDSCEATELRHEQSAAVLDERMACLDGHLRDLRALTEVFEQPDATVIQNAALAAMKLPAVEKCGNLAALQAEDVEPPAPSIENEVERLSERLALAKAQQDAGKTAEALEASRGVVQRAKDLRYEPLEAESLVRLGSVLAAAGKMVESENMLMEGAWLAEAHGMMHEVVRARSLLIYVVGFGLGRFEDGMWWSRHAEASLRRLPNMSTAQAEFIGNRGTLLLREGKFQDAYEAYLEVVELLPPDDPRQITALSNVAVAALEMRKLNKALEYLDRAITLGTELIGPSHPGIAMALGNQGVAMAMQGAYEEAEHSYRRALTIFREAGGSSSYYAAMIFHQLAELFAKQERSLEALEQFERARSLLKEAVGTHHPQYAGVLFGIGAVHEQREHYESALEHYQEGLSILADVDPKGILIQTGLTGKGRALINLDRRTEGLSSLERALTLSQAHPPPPHISAETRYALAHALKGIDDGRAKMLARQAVDVLSKLESSQDRKRAQEIEAWLAEYDVP